MRGVKEAENQAERQAVRQMEQEVGSLAIAEEEG